MINHFLAIEMSKRKRLIFHGILRFHLKTCVDITCFCKKGEVFDVTKNKKAEINLM